MNIDTKALIAATPATVALVRRELDKSREAQRGGCGTPKAVKVDCAMVERLCRIAEKQADRIAELEAELASAREAERVQRERAERERDRAYLYRNAVPESADYVDALDHIMRTARRSRTQSRRLRWIEARARCALEGGEDWKELDLPRFSESNQRYLQARIAELEGALAVLEAENSRLQAGIQLYKADFEHGLNGLKHEYAKLKQDNARLRGQISAMLGELEDFAMQNDLPIEDGHGYFGTGLPLGALQEWLFRQKDALAGGDA